MNWIKNFFNTNYINFQNYFESDVKPKIVEKNKELWGNYSLYINGFKSMVNLLQVYKKMPLMETLILLDGLILSFIFLKEYIILKVSENKLNSKRILDSQKDIILHYNKIYILDVYDRYLLYLCVYSFNYSIENILYYYNLEELFILKYILVILSFPIIQNYILSMPFINKYLIIHIKNKEIFIKYSISKVVVHFVEGLHINIIKIQNYHIFLIYKYVSFNYVWSIIKTYLFILLLYTLRSYTSLYKYYKAIKLAYYYESNILFNIMPQDMAVDLVNMVIKEKRWDSLTKIEILNAFYILISQKYKDETPLLINIQITLFKIFSIWSLISFCKVLFFSTIINYIYFIILTYALIKLKLKNVITSLIVYLLLLFNVNDIIITLVIISDKFIYYCLEEIYFFSLNAKNMRKMIKEYSESRKVDIKKEYCVIEKEN